MDVYTKFFCRESAIKEYPKGKPKMGSIGLPLISKNPIN